MASTSLFVSRDALSGLLRPALSGVGVELLDARPVQEPEQLSELRVAWWGNDVEVQAQPYSLPVGVQENYQHVLTLLSLPVDGDVDVLTAQADLLELMDLVFDLVQANRSLLTTATGDGWDVRISWDGFSQVSSKLERPPGFGAMVEVRIGVEATRCS